MGCVCVCVSGVPARADELVQGVVILGLSSNHPETMGGLV